MDDRDVLCIAVAPESISFSVTSIVKAAKRLPDLLHRAFCTFWSCSSSSRSFFVRLLRDGDLQAREDVALAAAVQLRRAAALIRSSLPPSEPAGTFSETGALGVGTSTFAPSAASANVTGTSTSRSAPRRL